jgi:predicted enzyme related to lactoylglutathione lyase
VLGARFWDGDVSVVPLPARAAAAGAPAHWLGHIGIADVEGTAARVVAAGGQQLGPLQRAADGSPIASLRDPFGAVIALSAEGALASHSAVAWRVSHSHDHDRAFAFYSALFGWAATERLELGPEMGSQQLFAWDESARSAGSMANTAHLPHIHPHWLFMFVVDDLEASLAIVRVRGGLTLPVYATARGDRVAACDDAQGAAFGLLQVA